MVTVCLLLSCDPGSPESKLGPDFKVRDSGRYRILSNLSGPQTDALAEILLSAERDFGALMGAEKSLVQDPIQVYYCRTMAELREVYKTIIGKPLDGAMGVTTYRPLRIFGSVDTGLGTARHEVIHACLGADWPAAPGWLHESMAFSVGARPSATLELRGKSYEIPDLYLSKARSALTKDKWFSLDRLFRTQDGLHGEGLDGEAELVVELESGIELKTRVGVLTTGIMFVRWLEATGQLPQWYRGFRESGDAAASLKGLRPQDAPNPEAALTEWVRAQKEAAGAPK